MTDEPAGLAAASGTGSNAADRGGVANSGVVFGDIIVSYGAGAALDRAVPVPPQPRPLVVVTIRLPVHEATSVTGERVWVETGWFGSALRPLLGLLRGTGGWVGWAGEAAPAGAASPAPFEIGGVQVQPVPLSADEIEASCEGFADSTLWPLYHDAVVARTYRRGWWEAYEKANRRFAGAAAAGAAQGATVWVHDYRLQLVPAMLRRMRPDLRIGFFLHIPFPPVELFMQLPHREDILRGLLGADVVGFQRPLAARNFLRLTRRLLGLRPQGKAVEVDNRLVRTAAFPISVDYGYLDSVAASPAVTAKARQIRAMLGGPTTMILCVDRLDYTMGIEQRLAAYRDLLAERRLRVPDTVLVQVVTPSRERVEEYRALRVRVEREVSRINGEYGDLGGPAVHYIHRPYHDVDLTALYRAADVMMVTPLRDGMNLVAKEYVAARYDLGGALVLSEFAGAAAELGQAFLCNPHDPQGLKDALIRAVHADPADAARRMRTMREHLAAHDAGGWVRSFLTALGVSGLAEPGREPVPGQAASG